MTQPAGHGFDEAAVEAVKRFVFTPAEIDFQPSAVQVEYVYHFVLKVVDAGVPEAIDAGPPPKAHATLKGTLITRGSRTRIMGGVVICVNQPGPEALSDEKGHFSLEIEAGECQVRVVSADHKNFETVEVLEPNETREVNYYVLPKVVGYETVVRGERDKKEVVDRTVSRQEMQKVPGTFGDPVRVMQNFPGVARAPFVSGALIVRGASANETLTFFDGVEIPILFHLGGGPSVVNAEFIDKIDFFPGGFGARYGRAIGGVVDVGSRRGAADTYHGVAKIDFLDSSLFFEAPLADGMSIAAAARRSYIDALLPGILPLVTRATRASRRSWCCRCTGTTRCASTSARSAARRRERLVDVLGVRLRVRRHAQGRGHRRRAGPQRQPRRPHHLPPRASATGPGARARSRTG